MPTATPSPRIRFAWVSAALRMSLAMGLAALVLGIGSARAPRAAHAVPTFTVDSTDDLPDGFMDGVCLGPLGQCTLRGAIEEANFAGGANINFNMPYNTGAGAVVYVNQYGFGKLPDITTPISFNGSTEPGFAFVTNVGIDGSMLSAPAAGLHIVGAGAGTTFVNWIAVSNFNGPGIHVDNSTGYVSGVTSGLDLTGTSAAPNQGAGVRIEGAGNGSYIDGSLISGNAGAGVEIVAGATGATLAGNYIGTNVGATAAIPNGGDGVLVASGANTIGIGSSGYPENVIAGNAGSGVHIATGSGANLVDRNFIGLSKAQVAIPNAGDGVAIGAESAGNKVRANAIRNNGGDGVSVTGAGSTDNLIQGNSIDANGGLGIDLNSDGVTANDFADADAGPNGLQNYPQILGATDGNFLVGSIAWGTFMAKPSTQYVFDLYSSAACDGSGYGEGAVYSSNAQGPYYTDRFGFTYWSLGTGYLGTAIPAGRGIAVTVREVGTDNTSEFSNCVVEGTACAGGNDPDCDGVLGFADNCMIYPNATQANTDSGAPPPAGNLGAFDNGPGIGTADDTIPNDDQQGDVCDTDHDNDGLDDWQDTEPLLFTGVCAAFGGDSDGHLFPDQGDISDDDDGDGVPAPPTGTDIGDGGPSWDTDNDGVLDGVECQLGHDPRNVTDKPTAAQCGGAGDADNDGLSAAAERCKWGTSDGTQTTDLDALKDCVEANDTNGDGVQNFPSDSVNSVKAVYGIIGKTQDFDLNGDGFVSFPVDSILSAKMANHIGGIC